MSIASLLIIGLLSGWIASFVFGLADLARPNRASPSGNNLSGRPHSEVWAQWENFAP